MTDQLAFRLATRADVPALSILRTAVAVELTNGFGEGHWSAPVSERGVELAMRHSYVLVLHDGASILGTLRLGNKKPWAIDKTYFTDVKKAIYLTDMAVDPARQRQGLGRKLIEEAVNVARDWPADAIRLDAYDAPAGAGDFYAKCGFAERGRVVYRKVPLVYYERLVTNPTVA